MKLLILWIVSAFAISLHANELEAICEQNDTANECRVINKTGELITKIDWTLEGSWVDYGYAQIVDLEDGASGTIKHPDGEDNCLFTFYTSITAFGKKKSYNYYQDGESKGAIAFNEKGQCTITLD